MSNVRETSIDTYYDLISSGVFAQEEKQVFEYIIEHPYSSDRDIRYGLKMEQASVTGRRNRLMNDGAILDVGKRKCTYTNRMVHVWIVNPAVTREEITLNRKRSRKTCSCCEGKGFVYD